MEFDDGRVEGFEGENHVPNGGSIEVGKPSTKTAWGPVKDRYVNGVGESAKKAKEQAIFSAEDVGVEILWSA